MCKFSFLNLRSTRYSGWSLRTITANNVHMNSSSLRLHCPSRPNQSSADTINLSLSSYNANGKIQNKKQIYLGEFIGHSAMLSAFSDLIRMSSFECIRTMIFRIFSTFKNNVAAVIHVKYARINLTLIIWVELKIEAN